MTEHDPTDAALLSRLRAGDADALPAIYERHKLAIVAVAAGVLGPHADLAWDVLHDVFVAFARNARSIAADSNVRAYLTRAAVNRSRDRLRSLRPTLDVHAVDPPACLDRSADGRDEAGEVWRAVAALPADQREVVARHVWAGESLRDIAAAEATSENTIQSRWRYALQKLRRSLKEVAP